MKNKPLVLKKLREDIDYLTFNHDEDEDYYLTCSKSGEDLLSIIDGERRIIKSHGQCSSCGQFFSSEHLQLNSTLSERWPVVYKGYHCKECYNNPTE